MISMFSATASSVRSYPAGRWDKRGMLQDDDNRARAIGSAAPGENPPGTPACDMLSCGLSMWPGRPREVSKRGAIGMPVSIRQLHPVFVGEVSGIDCRKPLSPEEVVAIDAGMDEYAVLVFRDQNVSDEEQIAFTRHFGELESYRTP